MKPLFKQHRQQCATCPFLRSCKPNDLGGSSPETYIGQSNHPSFWIPCHESINYLDPVWRDKYETTAQCAGTAIFRANNRLATESQLKLPADHEKVFSNYSEFLAHHAGITITEAADLLKWRTPDDHTTHELIRAACKVVAVVPLN